ncbi:Cation efflux system protein CusA [Caulifigura coniformis]|uniref:Cation efflux system protein CusA n=1 Tax=Caulifigura coniformis TaxID=2527983 RepID=A0A517S9H2_9PLAN|nr:efflux RND transporter permease subunit [Caulifigura coniformis]QDT52763.1 Cation efflux system protein CusA [Caulifigura coniformis]
MVNLVIGWCLRNRFFVMLVTVIVMAIGYYAITNIPIDAIPDIGEKQVIVLAEWPGRSPQDVEDQITYPLTVGLSGTPGVKTIRSFSGFGFSMVFIVFKDEVDYYWARSRVLERMNVAAGRLPQGVLPTLGADATALGQVFYYTLEAEGADLASLRSLQDWYIRYQLQAVEGVTEVATLGGYVREYQIDVIPEKLRAHRVSLMDVFEAVRRSNIDVGAKVVEANRYEFFVRGKGFVRGVQDLENVVIRQEEGTPIYVKNVATVQLGPEFRRGALDNAGREATGAVVLMRYGENPLAVINRLKQKISEIAPGLRVTLPSGKSVPVKLVPYYDRTDIIHETMATLRDNLIEESIVVTLIVALFLLHLRSTLTIVPTLPVALAMSFAAMYWLGVDSNIMSLAGLAIAIGDVSDMGIIMTENIYRRLTTDRGRPYFDVVYDAATEVGGAIVTAVVNTVVSFIPVFALTGSEGKMFRPLAYTKTFAIAASVILAITVVPVLCYYLLKPVSWPRRRALLFGGGAALATLIVMRLTITGFFQLPSAWSGWPTTLGVACMVGLMVYRMGRERLIPLDENPVSRGIFRIYRPILSWVLNNKATFLVLPTAVIALGFTVWLGLDVVGAPVSSLSRSMGYDVTMTVAWQRLKQTFPGIGREFMPPLDEGSFLYMPSVLPSASLTIAEEVVRRQDIAIRDVPEVKDVVGKVGRAESSLDPAPISMIETIVTLRPEEEWRVLPDPRWHSDTSWLDWCRPALRTVWPEERRITKAEILQDLNRQAAIPGVLPTWLQPIQTRLVMLQTGFRAMMGVKIYGSDLHEIERVGLQMEQILKKVPGTVDVVADRLVGKPYLEYEINREAAARYGVSIRDIQDVIEIAIGGEQITSTVEGRERYPVRVRYPREMRERFDDLEHVLVPTASGAQVPIAQVAKLAYSIGPQEIKSEDGLLVGYVTLNTRDRDEISVVEDAERLLQAERTRSDGQVAAGRHAEATLIVPPGYYWKWSGQFENQQRAMERLSILMPLVLLAMVFSVYFAFGKWWLVLLVLMDIAVSISGGFIGLQLYGANLSVAVWVGFIALVGVSDDDSVVMLTYLEDLFRERHPETVQGVRDLVIEAGLKRIRPCLMTTVTTVFGLAPIFLHAGRGSDIMQPMAIPSVGGMSVALITLFVIPCLYCLVKEWQLKQRIRNRTPQNGEVAHS